MNDYPVLDILLGTLWFFLVFAAIWMIITIVVDLFFRDHTTSGWAKAGWAVFLFVLPWFGALVYLIVRGRSMNERAAQEAERRELAVRQYVRSVAGPPSTADELTRLAELRDKGALSPGEYDLAKAAVLSRTTARNGSDGERAVPQNGTDPLRQPV